MKRSIKRKYFESATLKYAIHSDFSLSLFVSWVYIFLFLLCVTIVYYLVFFNLIKPDEVVKPIANNRYNRYNSRYNFDIMKSFLLYIYFTLIDRKPTSFIIFTMEGNTTISSLVLKIIKNFDFQNITFIHI